MRQPLFFSDQIIGRNCRDILFLTYSLLHLHYIGIFVVDIGSCSGQNRTKKGKDCLLRIGMRENHL